jgi:hypothetical protein
MIFFNNKANKVSLGRAGNAQIKSKIGFCLSRKNAWLLWLCQCLNIAVIALELSAWMLAIISLSLAWQALLLHQNKSRDRVKTSNNTNTDKHPSYQKSSNRLVSYR